MPRSNRGAIEAEYMKQYRARPEVKAKRAKYIKQCMKQYNVMHQAVAGERSTGFKTDAKTATRGGGGSKNHKDSNPPLRGVTGSVAAFLPAVAGVLLLLRGVTGSVTAFFQ